LSANKTLRFLPRRNIGAPILRDDLKQIPLLGRREALFDFSDLSADFVADRLVFLVQLFFSSSRLVTSNNCKVIRALVIEFSIVWCVSSTVL